MPNCELCGREKELVRAEIEGTMLTVCQECGKFGKVLGRVKTTEEIKKALAPKKEKIKEEGIEEKVVENFEEKIKKARERSGLSQEDFARFLNEKISVVQKWESGGLKPGIERAKEIGRALGMKLVEVVEEEKVELKGVKTGELTLGEAIKIRRRK